MPNSSPSLGGFAAAVTFIENDINATPALIDADVTFTDLEGNFNGGTVTVSRLLAEDLVAIRHQGAGAGQIGVSGTSVTYGGTIVGSFAGGVGTTLTVTFNAAATSAAVDALIQNLTYANADDTPVASHKLVLNVTDAAGATLGPAAVPDQPRHGCGREYPCPRARDLPAGPAGHPAAADPFGVGPAGPGEPAARAGRQGLGVNVVVPAPAAVVAPRPISLVEAA